MDAHFKLAIENVIRHGDTDIFPRPFETHVFFDRREDTLEVLRDYQANFAAYLERYGPWHISSFTPNGYAGFRWSTQLDPLWNLYFLGSVLACGEAIESARLPKEAKAVFSYRYQPDLRSGDLFDNNFSWPEFIARSEALCSDFEYVVTCDISEFYLRLEHHRLENALKQLNLGNELPWRIERFLHKFSNTKSYGLPVGGPAARLLSELTLNQIDRLLKDEGIAFVRFADDFHLYSASKEEAYQNLIYLSEKLFSNQGLLLQKSKTRILTTREFLTTSPFSSLRGETETAGAARALMQFVIRFDPYSITAPEDYQRLKEQLERIDIVGLLRAEVTKSRVHPALAKRIVAAVRFLEGAVRDDAILSLLDNADQLYPIFSSVLVVVLQTFDELAPRAQGQVRSILRYLIESKSHVMRVEIHRDLAVRILAKRAEDKDQSLFKLMFDKTPSSMLRRDIILALAQSGDWYWLSDLRNRFSSMSGPERRAFIVASFRLGEEGKHWRQHTTFSPFESLVQRWAASKSNQSDWVIPI